MPKKITQNVNKDKIFNDLPKVNPGFSKWLSKHSNYQSCNLGQIVPVYYSEILPGEKKKITMGMISHTTTPVAPIFNSLYTELRAFFVPFRICADLLNGYKTRKSPFVKVFGEDNASASSNVIVPLANQKLPEFTISHPFITSVYNYLTSLHNRDNVFDSLDLEIDSVTKQNLIEFNYLNLAAYELIYQRHYRNENYEAATDSDLYKLLFDAYNVSKAAFTYPRTLTFEHANREKDYFTGMKPFTQKGDPVKVGLVGNAPVITGDVNTALATEANYDYKLKSNVKYLKFGVSSEATSLSKSGVGIYHTNGATKGQAISITSPSDESYTGNLAPINLYADLSSVNGISIEELRLLVKTQELLEKDALYGSLYAESLNAHFGCCPLDLTLQDPQELYKTTVTSQMQAIFQTSSTASENSILGTIGANSTTQTDPFVILPETKFEEHGILMICAVHKLQNVYDATWFKPKMNFKKSRFDFYTPELNDLGYQPVTKSEARNFPSVVGYNEAFAEYRYSFNKCHGQLNIDFPYWAPSIADDYGSASTLYKEGPEILDRALSVSSINAPQFYDAWGFEEECTKPMSLHSIPGFDGVI